MTKRKELAQIGEELAAAYLEKNDYKIVRRNFRFGRFELDIIAKEEDILIFVEVKTRSNCKFGYPETAVGKIKQMHMAKAAEAYCLEIDYKGEIRFDVIALVRNQKEKTLFHFKDAFFPNKTFE